MIKIEGNNFNQRCVIQMPDDICRTLIGQGHSGMEPKVIQKCGDRDKNNGYSIHNYSNTIPANPMSDRGQLLLEKENKGRYRIRKLTPRECFVLMGLTMEDCDKCADVGVSNSQLYKQAGNGIITNCIELLFEHLYKSQYDPSFETFDECYTKNFTQAVTA